MVVVHFCISGMKIVPIINIACVVLSNKIKSAPHKLKLIQVCKDVLITVQTLFVCPKSNYWWGQKVRRYFMNQRKERKQNCCATGKSQPTQSWHVKTAPWADTYITILVCSIQGQELHFSLQAWRYAPERISKSPFLQMIVSEDTQGQPPRWSYLLTAQLYLVTSWFLASCRKLVRYSLMPGALNISV